MVLLCIFDKKCRISLYDYVDIIEYCVTVQLTEGQD
jgi:hypothetical protein